MTTRVYSDERRWANTDPARHCNTPEPRKPDWREEYLDLLIRGDNAGAHELRLRNDERYSEECQQRAASVFPVKGSELKSLTACESERKAQEAA